MLAKIIVINCILLVSCCPFWNQQPIRLIEGAPAATVNVSRPLSSSGGKILSMVFGEYPDNMDAENMTSSIFELYPTKYLEAKLREIRLSSNSNNEIDGQDQLEQESSEQNVKSVQLSMKSSIIRNIYGFLEEVMIASVVENFR